MEIIRYRGPRQRHKRVSGELSSMEIGIGKTTMLLWAREFQENLVVWKFCILLVTHRNIISFQENLVVWK